MRAESFHPVVDRIEAGRFHEGPAYATWRRHGTTDWLLLVTLGGHGRISWPDGHLRTAAGDLALIRPGVTHDYGTARGTPGWELQFAHFHPRGDWAPLLDWPAASAGIGRLTVTGEAWRRVRESMQRAIELHASGLRAAQQFGLNALETALLWAGTQRPDPDPVLDPRLITVLEHITAHLGEPLDVAELAGVAGLSPSRLTHLFSSALGCAPMRFVEQQRLARARQLLELTDRPVAGIGRTVGFADPLYFSNRFRRHTGLSPSRFRARARHSAP